MYRLTVAFLLIAVLTAGGQSAPINNCNSSPDNSTNTTATNGPAVNTKIAALQVAAEEQVIRILQEIRGLENYTVRL